MELSGANGFLRLFVKFLDLILYLIIGKIIHSHILGIDMIIINSETIAQELLEKCSVNYSTRPVLCTNELYVLSVFIQFVLHPLTIQSWTGFQFCDASVLVLPRFGPEPWFEPGLPWTGPEVRSKVHWRPWTGLLVRFTVRSVLTNCERVQTGPNQ
ncbi:uncharacterized protein F5147DRAFT_591345 [Suillus discolor]|uniref:Uncharacterized protein n=1 Tax=Suillus discolor TaxID=1912936 RepID=A0A9P7EQX5_9AGAM|nr:uncharacterized protein F5147DRAFT_591345 [Suillus discolor]KAG2080713.1 hypothetical protein F5147DRAFT_591345 [Suillus discolor]